ncbi:hypothetical protein CLV63_1331 [Murinocardiopsis flavida]|uniref:Uncharacterized protein n=1 Tax=Murinocardiopsis flavida TaxID=645275 RepID=A0A2P8CPK2_9ACTN|nr:hypothetical protein CLV63_1331 [Murinocardiopsis flavida]
MPQAAARDRLRGALAAAETARDRPEEDRTAGRPRAGRPGAGLTDLLSART